MITDGRWAGSPHLSTGGVRSVRRSGPSAETNRRTSNPPSARRANADTRASRCPLQPEFARWRADVRLVRIEPEKSAVREICSQRCTAPHDRPAQRVEARRWRREARLSAGSAGQADGICRRAVTCSPSRRALQGPGSASSRRRSPRSAAWTWCWRSGQRRELTHSAFVNAGVRRIGRDLVGRSGGVGVRCGRRHAADYDLSTLRTLVAGSRRARGSRPGSRA
jgi:hypothetical protein